MQVNGSGACARESSCAGVLCARASKGPKNSSATSMRGRSWPELVSIYNSRRTKNGIWFSSFSKSNLITGSFQRVLKMGSSTISCKKINGIYKRDLVYYHISVHYLMVKLILIIYFLKRESVFVFYLEVRII